MVSVFIQLHIKKGFPSTISSETYSKFSQLLINKNPNPNTEFTQLHEEHMIISLTQLNKTR